MARFGSLQFRRPDRPELNLGFQLIAGSNAARDSSIQFGIKAQHLILSQGGSQGWL
jgi:hypothetical protein